MTFDIDIQMDLSAPENRELFEALTRPDFVGPWQLRGGRWRRLYFTGENVVTDRYRIHRIEEWIGPVVDDV